VGQRRGRFFNLTSINSKSFKCGACGRSSTSRSAIAFGMRLLERDASNSPRLKRKSRDVDYDDLDTYAEWMSTGSHSEIYGGEDHHIGGYNGQHPKNLDQTSRSRLKESQNQHQRSQANRSRSAGVKARYHGSPGPSGTHSNSNILAPRSPLPRCLLGTKEEKRQHSDIHVL